MAQQYVTRILRLGCLSPRIVEGIAEGNVALSLSLETLKRDFPLDWAEQEKHFLRKAAA